VTHAATAVRRSVIEIAGLQRIYRLGNVDVAALRGIDLTIAAGEFVAIMGASGSGKSTLLHILGCLDRPTAGAYRLEGVDVKSLDDEALAAIRSRRIGFVFQSFNLLARTSAAGNVALPLLYCSDGGGPRAARAVRAQAVLERLGLGALARHNPNQLSGGQQQLVGVARALIAKPSLILADEPTGNLDPDLSLEIMNLLREINAGGTTVVVATHDRELIRLVGRRTVTLDQGRVVEIA